MAALMRLMALFAMLFFSLRIYIIVISKRFVVITNYTVPVCQKLVLATGMIGFP